MSLQDKPIEIETSAKPDAAVIWLHGLGADGNDFVPIVPELRLPASLRLRFVFPHAPVRPVTVNGGMAMRAWYDIIQMGGGRQDAEGIEASRRIVDGLIARQKENGIAANRIVLAGFSQGGAIALHTGLRHPERLAGIMALSTYLPLHDRFQKERHAANAETPILMTHGVMDPVISIDFARQSRALLEKEGHAPEWHDYAMAHSVCAEEVVDMSAWLQRVLAR